MTVWLKRHTSMRGRLAIVLVVMLVPRTREEWLSAGHDHLALRHCCYWTNLAGHRVTGRRRTTVRIPTTRIFDDRAVA